MAKELELYLEKDGFYAGSKLKSGKLGAGAHKITEEEIITMFSVIMRTYVAKTGQATMLMKGDDGKAIIAKLVDYAEGGTA